MPSPYQEFKLVNIIIGKNIARIRKERGWTQEDIGKLLKQNRATIANFERGKHGLATKHLWLMCVALKASPNEIFPNTKGVTMKDAIKIYDKVGK